MQNATGCFFELDFVPSQLLKSESLKYSARARQAPTQIPSTWVQWDRGDVLMNQRGRNRKKKCDQPAGFPGQRCVSEGGDKRKGARALRCVVLLTLSCPPCPGLASSGVVWCGACWCWIVM